MFFVCLFVCFCCVCLFVFCLFFRLHAAAFCCRFKNGASVYFWLCRYADTKAFPRVTESTVWDVLKAADKYQVLPLVLHCFHFLLHKHRRRGRGEHLCAVLEMAHHLHYEKQYKQCLRKVQRKAGTILKSSSTSSSLSQLCHACFLDVIRGDYLGGIEEAIVHDAVMTWTRRACAGRGGGTSEPSWDELRATAGQLVYHVRYLAMPRPTLMRLLEGHPFSCLLTRDEMDNLLNHGGSLFPPTVRWPRKEKPSRGKRRAGVAGLICRFVVVLVVVQLVFLVQFLVVKSVICPLAQPRETAADSGSYLNASVCD